MCMCVYVCVHVCDCAVRRVTRVRRAGSFSCFSFFPFLSLVYVTLALPSVVDVGRERGMP